MLPKFFRGLIFQRMLITVEEAYIRFKQKSEKNITNNAISTDRGRFVRTFNEIQNRIIEIYLQNRGFDDIEDISLFLVPDKEIFSKDDSKERQYFPLPKNYLDFSSLRSYASFETCKGQEINVFKIKSENISEILQDEFNKPSFIWREAPFVINQNNITLFNAGEFKFDKILLNYYRYPNQIALLSPDNPESNFNEAIKIEWGETMLNRIISIVAGETDMNLNNPRFQLQNARAQK